MSGDGVHHSGMGRSSSTEEHLLEALRTGQAPEGHPELEAVAALGAEMRAVHDAEPVPPMGAELAELVRSGGIAPAGVGEQAPASAVPVRRRWVRTLAAGVAATLGVVAGLGAAGALPAPVQRAVASTAEVVGLDFPRPPAEPPPSGPVNDDPAPLRPSPCPTPSSTSSPGPSTTNVPPTTNASPTTIEPCQPAPTTTTTTTTPVSSTTTVAPSTASTTGTTGQTTTSTSPTTTAP